MERPCARLFLFLQLELLGLQSRKGTGEPALAVKNVAYVSCNHSASPAASSGMVVPRRVDNGALALYVLPFPAWKERGKPGRAPGPGTSHGETDTAPILGISSLKGLNPRADL